MKSKDLQPRLLYPAKLSFRIKGKIKCFPDKVSSSASHYYMKCYRDLFKKKNIKTVNIKMKINSQLSTIESKKLSKQAEQEQNHRYGDNLEGYQLGGGRGSMRERYRD